MSVVSANDFALVSVELHVPQRGAWWARIEFVDAPEIEDGAAVDLAIDQLHLTGTILSDHDGTHGGHRRALVFAGGAGWGTEVTPLHYRSDTGVSAQLVVDDAIRAAGETLGTFEPAAEHLGPHYVRQSGLARRVLEDAIGDVLWWVDYDGTTHVADERPTVAVDSEAARVLDYDPLERVVSLEVQNPDDVVVGSELTEGLDDPQTVRELDLTADETGLFVRVWTGAGRYGLVDSQAFAVHRRYSDGHLWGSWRYRVIGMNGDKIDARPVLGSHGLPELVAIELSPGIPGAAAELADGAEVLIEFVEGNRSLPRVVAFAGHDQGAWAPPQLVLDGDEVLIGEGATKEAARKEDTVEVTIPSGTVIVSVAGGNLNLNPITLAGTISSGSAKVKIE